MKNSSPMPPAKQQVMTDIQLERWMQLSTGLAKSSYPTIEDKQRSELLDAIKDCIEYIVCNGIETIADWDQSIYENGQLAHYGAGVRMNDYLWDNQHEFERDLEGDIEVVTTQLGEMLSCCVRAGFDVAVAPSAGVVGFTYGELCGAFDGELPEWVIEFFGDDLPADAAPSEGVWL